MLLKNQPSPCIGLCSTTYGDKFCRGCKRSQHEVSQWLFDKEIQEAYWERMCNITSSIIPTYLQIINYHIFDEAILKRKETLPYFLKEAFTKNSKNKKMQQNLYSLVTWYIINRAYKNLSWDNLSENFGIIPVNASLSSEPFLSLWRSIQRMLWEKTYNTVNT